MNRLRDMGQVRGWKPGDVGSERPKTVGGDPSSTGQARRGSGRSSCLGGPRSAEASLAGEQLCDLPHEGKRNHNGFTVSMQPTGETRKQVRKSWPQNRPGEEWKKVTFLLQVLLK